MCGDNSRYHHDQHQYVQQGQVSPSFYASPEMYPNGHLIPRSSRLFAR